MRKHTVSKHKVCAIGRIAALSLMLALFGQWAHAQQVYRWVDKNGRVTYSQDPPPAGAAKNVQQRRITGGGGGGGDATLPYAVVMAAQNFPVTFYTAPGCNEACKDGRDLLSKRGIPFKEVVAADDQSLESLRKLTGNTRVPALQVGRQSYSGFTSETWTSALNEAGYPASVPASARRSGPTNVQRNLPVVKLYATPNCGVPCRGAKDLLAGRKITFQEVILDNEESVEELKKAIGNIETVPVLMIGGSSLTGFSPERYHAALDNAGFQQQTAAR